jgi:uncharacterized damage-inducible protein DinB
LVDEAFDHKSWHGTTLRGSLRGLSTRQVEWRPAPRRHNIHELVIHAAYWKYAVRQRISGGPRGGFARKGSNWFTAPADSWTNDLHLLDEEHRRLRELIASLPERALATRVKQSATVAYLVRGIAAHDLYHAGQIQLLKRLQRA